jgi:hypothetical protein
MSGTTAEPRAEARESVAGVVGVLVGLGLIAWGTWTALRPGAELADPGATLGRAFQSVGLPFGLELGAGVGARLPDGSWVVSLSAGSHVPWDGLPGEPPESPPEDPVQPAGAGRAGPSKVDWAALAPVVQPVAPPAQVLLVRWPLQRSAEERRRLFEGLRFKAPEELGAKGGRVLVQREQLDWHGLAAPAARERNYRLVGGEPGFVESVRVDLTRPGEPWMLVAIWPPGHAAALEPVRAILDALVPAER